MTRPRFPARQLPDTAGPSAGLRESPPARTAGGAAPAPGPSAAPPGLPAALQPGPAALWRWGLRETRAQENLCRESLSWLTPQPLPWPQTWALLPPLQGSGSCLLCEPRNPRNNLPISEGTVTNECDPREKPDALSGDITSGKKKNQKKNNNPTNHRKRHQTGCVPLPRFGISQSCKHTRNGSSGCLAATSRWAATARRHRREAEVQPARLSASVLARRSILRERQLLRN